MNLYHHRLIKKAALLSLTVIGILQIFFTANTSTAFPLYAQQGYENPREATGRIVCANCHLAQKNISLEVPKAVLPNTVFEATIKLPYNLSSEQILSNGKKGSMNVGAVLILPEGFKMAPSSLVSEEIKAKTKNVYIQPYSTTKQNILVVGPMPGNKNQEITFPILSPDPSQDKSIHFLKYPIYAGGNRGRGQVYPSGDKSNNNPIVSTASGQVSNIELLENGGYKVDIETVDSVIVSEAIPGGLDLQIKKGEKVSAGQLLTQDPNVGGFGQNETEIVLQSPGRIKGMIAFFIVIATSQIFFVIKKKQWEKVQRSEMSF
jgi:apocytochrome f